MENIKKTHYFNFTFFMRNLDSKQLWVFRVSSKPEVGGGHVMRRISIAVENQQNQSVWSENSGATILVDPLE